MDNKLFSVIVLCYRHFEYLYTAIDSVLSQTYPQIELIISDDGSDNFPRHEVEEYIRANKNNHIKNVVIHQETENVGTVRHLNHATRICTGAYVAALAGDDIFFDERVLERYAAGFQHAPENCYIEMAQTGMYDENLEKLDSYYLKPPVQAAIEKTATDSSELLKVLIEFGACLPSTSTCFRREFFEKFGKFDERYNLVEDYPMHVRLAEEGWIIHYENFVAIKHRNGGISHGQKNTLSRSAMLYFSDDKRMIEEIILKKKSVLDRKAQKSLIKKQKKQLLWLEYTLAKARRDHAMLLKICIMNPGQTLLRLLGKAWPFAYQWHTKLFFICCGFWGIIPIVTQMLETILQADASAVPVVLYGVNMVLFIGWLYAFIVYWLNRLIGKIHHFPSETLAIG